MFTVRSINSVLFTLLGRTYEVVYSSFMSRYACCLTCVVVVFLGGGGGLVFWF